MNKETYYSLEELLDKLVGHTSIACETNCDNVYCNEIKGNVVNCDKIIYKK